MRANMRKDKISTAELLSLRNSNRNDVIIIVQLQCLFGEIIKLIIQTSADQGKCCEARKWLLTVGQGMSSRKDL